MISLLLLLSGFAEPHGPTIAFPAPSGPANLQVIISLDGEYLDKKWDAFLDRLFDRADTNKDRFLSRSESARIFPVSLPNGKIQLLDFPKCDEDNDGKLTKIEFRNYYRKIGFEPIVPTIRTLPDEQAFLSDNLFRHLDRNGDGRISDQEWESLPELMFRFDENEDEFLDPRELMGTSPARSTKKNELSAYLAQSPGKNQAEILIDLGQQKAISLKNHSSSFRLIASQNKLLVPDGTINLKIENTNPITNFRSTKEFYFALFAEGLKKKTGLTKEEIESETDLASILDIFPFADGNGDGVLTQVELGDLFDLIEMGISLQSVVSLEQRGKNLFEFLDADSDGRLDVGELTKAAKSGTTIAEKKDLPWSYRLVAFRGPLNSQFGPMRIPSTSKPDRPIQPEKLKVASWFSVLDVNKDGFVSRMEFRGRPDTFAKLDKDLDNRISAKEAEDFGN